MKIISVSVTICAFRIKSDVIQSNMYQILLKVHGAVIVALKPGNKATDAYKDADTLIRRKHMNWFLI